MGRPTGSARCPIGVGRCRRYVTCTVVSVMPYMLTRRCLRRSGATRRAAPLVSASPAKTMPQSVARGARPQRRARPRKAGSVVEDGEPARAAAGRAGRRVSRLPPGHHDQARRREQGPEQLPDRDVEGDRSGTAARSAVRTWPSPPRRGERRPRPAVAVHDALGETGGAGGVDDVGRVVRPTWAVGAVAGGLAMPRSAAVAPEPDSVERQLGRSGAPPRDHQERRRRRRRAGRRCWRSDWSGRSARRRRRPCGCQHRAG